MLKDAEVFSGFAVDDVPRAKEFYGTTLGLEVADAPLGVEGAEVPPGLELRLGAGTRVLVYPKPDHTPATFTILNFLVEDIERTVDELAARGVRFERYDTPRTDARGIHRTPEVHPVAWFRDPAGNILHHRGVIQGSRIAFRYWWVSPKGGATASPRSFGRVWSDACPVGCTPSGPAWTASANRGMGMAAQPR